MRHIEQGIGIRMAGLVKKNFFFIVAGMVVLAAIIWAIASINFTSWDFRNNLWGPAYLLWRGESAYNIDILFDNSNAVWFPQIVGLFSPLGLLSLSHATNVWLFLNIFLLIILIYYLSWQVQQKKPKPIMLGAVVLAVFLFPPTIRHLVLGQVDVIVIAALIAATYALERDRFILCGLFVTIAVVKPQLCVLVLPAIVCSLLFQRRWGNLIKLISSTVLFGSLLTVPLWISNRLWLTDFLANLQRNQQWLQPALLSQLTTYLGKPGLILWLFLFTAVLIICIRFWLKSDPTNAVLWSLALTTIVGPYVWSWDFILLLPLFIYTAVRLTNNLSRFILFGFYVICFAISVITLQLHGSSDSSLWWFPFVMMIGIILSINLDRPLSRPSAIYDR